VHGVTRGSSSDIPERLAHIVRRDVQARNRFKLHIADILDVQAMTKLLVDTQPHEFYNLAAQSSVGQSFARPLETLKVDAIGVLSILELVRTINPKIRVFQASSSEIFGRAHESPQNENTHPYPCSPYAIAKLFSLDAVRVYRESYALHACCGILYNHESPRRSGMFVTQKIVQAAVRIRHGLQDVLRLGNLSAARDWGHAKDVADCIWRILQADNPADFVVATGESHTVREFVQLAFSNVGIKIEFQGTGLAEVGIDVSTRKTHIKVDPSLYRPMEPSNTFGDSGKARSLLGWQPEYDFRQLVREMVLTCELQFQNTRIF